MLNEHITYRIIYMNDVNIICTNLFVSIEMVKH